MEYPIVPTSTKAAPIHIIPLHPDLSNHTALINKLTAFLTASTRVTVRLETLVVSLCTPEIHNSWVKVFRRSGIYASGIETVNLRNVSGDGRRKLVFGPE